MYINLTLLYIRETSYRRLQYHPRRERQFYSNGFFAAGEAPALPPPPPAGLSNGFSTRAGGGGESGLSAYADSKRGDAGARDGASSS